MTLMTASLDWLRSDVPATRTQARLGAIWRISRRLAQQPIGIAGLMLLAIVIALAIGANWLPLADPLAQSLGDRLLAPSSRPGLAPIPWGATSFPGSCSAPGRRCRSWAWFC